MFVQAPKNVQEPQARPGQETVHALRLEIAIRKTRQVYVDIRR